MEIWMENSFWAKTTSDKKPGISVLEHMMNVGFVARTMAARREELLRLFGLKPSLVGALAALHDLGKISPGFQRKCEEWLRETNLFEIARRWNWEQEMEPDHGKVTHAIVQEYFCEKGVDETTAMFLSAVLGGHHGRLNPPNERGFKPQKSVVEPHSGIDWETERKQAADAVVSQLGARLNELSTIDSSPALWWLAGLTSVADWIGSDKRYFPVERGMEIAQAVEAAEKCLQEIGFARPKIVQGLSFHHLFYNPKKPDDVFVPNKMQAATLSTITGTGVYIIEAPTGMGKTEAALAAAYNLLVSGEASGIYFALPTQATSNRMHLRMKEFVERIAPSGVESKIIHSNSWLTDNGKGALSPANTVGNEDGAEVGRDWFSSAKRALIAPFGVGTVDQALLGIVAAKHFFVRHFALAGKVVILDEIHSYDLYTGTLIDRLIETLEKLSCTVIVLSATLSRARRAQIIPVNKTHGPSPAKEPYPLITGRRQGKQLKPLAVAPPKPKTVDVAFKPVTEAISLAVDAATKGACVVWVCNTVDSAQQVYLRLKNRSTSGFPIGLLHSRFPFWRREQLEDEWMNRLGKESSTRCASILVSSQIVEQSVDLDADLMISELAPTDMLLQRMGRLWRHKRGKKDRHVSKPRLYIVEERQDFGKFRKMKPKEIVEAFGNKALVYDPYVLLRSLEEWKKLKKITLPTGVRKLIEATYKERVSVPHEWRKLMEKAEGEKIAYRQKALMSTNVWQVQLNDEDGVQTRINELPTLSIVLCCSMSEALIEFIDGSSCSFDGEEFHLPTAQAIHRNLLRIPDYHFGITETHPVITRYLRGKYAIGRVASNGTVSAKGLKDGITLHWDINLGLVIEKGK
jgi:CRISPR-associated endonuclease/helicase Cas3